MLCARAKAGLATPIMTRASDARALPFSRQLRLGSGPSVVDLVLFSGLIALLLETDRTMCVGLSGHIGQRGKRCRKWQDTSQIGPLIGLVMRHQRPL